MQVRPIERVGERAKLLPLQESHEAGLIEAGKHPEIWTHMSMRGDTSVGMRRWVSQALSARETGSELPFVIIDQQSGEIVGSTRLLDISIVHRSAEIGWTWLDPKVWRTRINTECKYLLLKHCFEDLGMVRVQIKTDSRNVRSQRAIERIGGVKEGVLRKHRVLDDGYIRDSVYYSIIDDEWPNIEERLLRKLGTGEN